MNVLLFHAQRVRVSELGAFDSVPAIRIGPDGAALRLGGSHSRDRELGQAVQMIWTIDLDGCVDARAIANWVLESVRGLSRRLVRREVDFINDADALA